MRAIVEHGDRTVSVLALDGNGGLGNLNARRTPGVIVRVGVPNDSVMKLTPWEARRVALALLQAAEQVEVPAH